MGRSRQSSLKASLRTRCLPELKARYAYVDVGTLRAWLDGNRLAWNAATLNRYMVELVESGFVWSAGRGWYSFVAEPFELDTAPLAEIAAALQEKFPLLDFACWSTQQVNPYMHHLLGKFVTFVHAPRDAMPAAYDHLRALGWTAFLHPTKAEAAKTFTVEERTAIVRPLASKTPLVGHAMRIEGLLVDLYLELQTLPLMDPAEFRGMAARLASARRIEFAELVSYAKRRGTSPDGFFGPDNQLSPVCGNSGDN